MNAGTCYGRHDQLWKRPVCWPYDPATSVPLRVSVKVACASNGLRGLSASFALYLYCPTAAWGALPAGETLVQAAGPTLQRNWLEIFLITLWICAVSIVMFALLWRRRNAMRRQTLEVDPLTKLKNRNYLRRYFPQLAASGPERLVNIHLAAIDLDGFQLVNDTLGHQAGDAILVIAARRIEQCVRRHDLVARIGADEFIVILHNAAEDTVEDTMHRIISSLHAPMQIGSELTTITASIGLATHTGGQQLETLLLQADTALFQAKKQGRNAWKRFSPLMDAPRIAAADLHKRLRSALVQNQFVLMYQPKWSSQSRRLIGVEALVRWKDPQRGLRLPGEFIGIAERIGLIGELGNWVMREACAQIRRWMEHGWHVPVAINVSGLQVAGQEMPACVEEAIACNSIPPHSLTLEITESVAIEDPHKTMEVFQQLRHMGVAISIDDFGTGYSSLAYLKRFPATELKIDRSFIDDIVRNQQSLELVRAVIAMGHALDMKVVAEGVENEHTAAMLEHLQCDILQGNYLGVPVMADEIPPLLHDDKT